MARDLGRHPEVYAEREQVSLRLGGDERGYEKVKAAIENGEFSPKLGPYLGEAVSLARLSPRVVRRLLKSSP